MTPEEIAEKYMTLGYLHFDKSEEGFIFRDSLARDIRLYAEAREQAAAKEMLEKCAGAVNSYAEEGQSECIPDRTAEDCDEINCQLRKLSPSTHSLDRAVLEARLEEAKWWVEFGKIKDFHEQVLRYRLEHPEEISTCEHCQRIAEIESELRKITEDNSDSMPKL